MGSYKGSLRIAATADVIEAVFLVDDHHLTVNTGGEALGSWALADLRPDDTGSEVLLALDGENVAVNVVDHDGFIAALAPPKSKRRARHAKPKRSPKSKKTRPSPKSEETRPSPKSEEVKRPPKSEEVKRPPKSEEVKRPPKSEKIKRPPKSEKIKPSRERRNLLPFLRRLFSKDAWHEWLSDTTVLWVIASAVVVTVAALAIFATNSLGMILVLLGMVALIIAALAVSDDLTAYSWIPGNLSEATLVIAGAIAMALGGLLIVIS